MLIDGKGLNNCNVLQLFIMVLRCISFLFRNYRLSDMNIFSWMSDILDVT